MSLWEENWIPRAKMRFPKSRTRTPVDRTRVSLRFIGVLFYVTGSVALMGHSWRSTFVVPLVWVWGEWLISMFMMIHGTFTRLSKGTWASALLGQTAALLSLWSGSPRLAWFSFDIFSLVGLLTLQYRNRRRSASIAVSLLAAMSPVAGMLIGHHAMHLGDQIVMIVIPSLWAQAHIQHLYLFWHSQYCQKVRMSFPLQEEKLKSRGLIWSVLTALLSLVPYYLGPPKGSYLAGSLLMSIGYLGATGLGIISSSSRRPSRLTWRQYISEAYLVGIVTLFVSQYG